MVCQERSTVARLPNGDHVSHRLSQAGECQSMNKSVRDLIRRYDFLSGHHKIVDGSERYAGLVTANGNRTTAVQRWFHAKEAFSVRLLEEVVADLDISLKRSEERRVGKEC